MHYGVAQSTQEVMEAVVCKGGRYDGIYRAMIEIFLPVEIWPYCFYPRAILTRSCYSCMILCNLTKPAAWQGNMIRADVRKL